MQTILSRHPKAKVRVFAVWEPILITDWSAPGSFVRGRLSDDRVRQFWDPQHMVAAQMSRDAHPPQPEPHCCDDRGILWDLAAVYPRDAVWGSSLPARCSATDLWRKSLRTSSDSWRRVKSATREQRCPAVSDRDARRTPLCRSWGGRSRCPLRRSRVRRRWIDHVDRCRRRRAGL